MQETSYSRDPEIAPEYRCCARHRWLRRPPRAAAPPTMCAIPQQLWLVTFDIYLHKRDGHIGSLTNGSRCMTQTYCVTRTCPDPALNARHAHVVRAAFPQLGIRVGIR